MAGGGRVKSLESSQAENNTYSIHVEGDLKRFPGREHRSVFKFPGREHQNVFKFLGERKLNRGREFENVFRFLCGGFENVNFEVPGGNLKTLHRYADSTNRLCMVTGFEDSIRVHRHRYTCSRP